MEVVVTNGAIRRAKLQSNRHHQQTNTQLFYRPDALPVPKPTVSKHHHVILKYFICSEEVMFSLAFVCLFISWIMQKKRIDQFHRIW